MALISCGIRPAAGSTVDLTAVAASRISGVAPLLVVFDSHLATTTSSTRPFQDLELRWNYGDSGGSPVSGTTWTTGSRATINSRNTRYGPNGGHVYETPGTYIATVQDAYGIASKQFTITVDDPEVTFAGAKTVLVSTSGNFSGAGVGWGTLTTSDLATALGAATSGNTVRRILFRAGEIWNVAAPISFAVTSTEGLIGSFGAGANPVWKAQAGVFVLDDIMVSFSNAGTPTSMNNWRLMDVKFDGTNYSPGAFNATGLGGGIDFMLWLRVKTDSVRLGILADPGLLDFQGLTHIWTGGGIVDCTFSNPTPGNASYGTFMGGDRFYFAGNHIDGTSSHNTRWPYLGVAVIENNDLWNPGSSEHSIKLHGPQFGASGKAQSGLGQGYTRWVGVSDNSAKSKSGGNPYQFGIGVEVGDGSADQRLLDIVTERNYHIFGNGTTVAQFFWCAEFTARNNIIIMDGGADHIGFAVDQRGGTTQIPDNGRFYNNTIYTGDTLAGAFIGVKMTANDTNMFVRNNIGYAPNDSAPVMTFGGSPTSDHNSANLRTSPNFTGTTTYVGFTITAGSYAITAGNSSVPIYSDAYLVSRPQGATPDIGAAKF